MSTKQIILVVEDEGIIARDIRASLEKLGYAVPALASTGEAAVERADEIRPDLVLMDIRLRGQMDGIQAAERIRAFFDIPVVYLTAHADDETLARAKVTEPSGYIIKPFDEKVLQTNLEIALYKHEMEKKLRLRESRRWLTATLRGIGDAVIATDSKGLVVLMNPVAEELTGWTQEEALAKDLTDVFNVVSTESRESINSPLGDMLSGKAALWVGDDAILIASDGRETPTDSNATPIRNDSGDITGIVVVFRDISERKQADEALRQQEELFRTLVENSSDATTILNADGTLLYESPSTTRLLGYEPGAHLGKTSLELVHPDDLPHVAEAMAHLLDRPDGMAQIDVRVRHKDGSWRTLEVVARNLLHDPIVAGIVVNQRDITERKQAEEEKRTMEEQIQLAGRLAAIGELAAGIAHELNNPLAAVQGFAQLLSARQDLDEDVRGNIATIYNQAQRATRITSNLLSFARRHMPQKDLVSINEAVKTSMELHAYRLRVNNLSVHMELDPELPMTMADFNQLQQVFANIINNAEQAMTEAHGKGTLRIMTHNTGETIQISFADDGPGIVAEDIKKIFDPFFTTKDAGKGTGLGLGISLAIAKEHGGRLYVESEPGLGARFVVELPIVSESQHIEQQLDPLQVRMPCPAISEATPSP